MYSSKIKAMENMVLKNQASSKESRQIDSKDDEKQGPSLEEDEVRAHLNKLGMQKSMEPDEMHPPPWGNWSISLQGHSLFNLSKVIGIQCGNWRQE